MTSDSPDAPGYPPLGRLVGEIRMAERLRDSSQRLDDGDSAAFWDGCADQMRIRLRAHVERLTGVPFDRLSDVL